MLLSLVTSALAAPGVSERTVDHLGGRYRVVTVDLRTATVDLVGQAGRNLPSDLIAATNAGLFHAPDDPVGLWIEEGVERSPLTNADGVGNFFLKPNGVFWIDDAGAHVADAAGFDAPASTRLATQSGPALLLDGRLHPALRPDSDSLKVRNAVGVSDPWTVHLVVSDGPVRFHDLATLYRDELGCDDAVYLDGSISGLWPDAQGLWPDVTRYAGFLVVVPRLAEGDVVFQRSTSDQAAAIAAATGSDWTHTGIVRLIDGAPWVLEATQPVKLTRYETWVARGVGGRVGVRRLREGTWTPEATAALDRLQAEWLGRPYDARFGWDDDALYCSELVHKAYARALGVDLAPLRPVGSYQVSDPALRDAMRRRWGAVPESLEVVAPSDLFISPLLRPVP